MNSYELTTSFLKELPKFNLIYKLTSGSKAFNGFDNSSHYQLKYEGKDLDSNLISRRDFSWTRVAQSEQHAESLEKLATLIDVSRLFNCITIIAPKKGVLGEIDVDKAIYACTQEYVRDLCSKFVELKYKNVQRPRRSGKQARDPMWNKICRIGRNGISIPADDRDKIFNYVIDSAAKFKNYTIDTDSKTLKRNIAEVESVITMLTEGSY